MVYYIYEVPGEKNGATINWDIRFKYNFNRYQIEPILVETMEGPNTPEYWQVVGDREWYYADLNGYPRGQHYLKTRLIQLKADTPQTRQKMSDSATGRFHTEATKQLCREASTGRVHSEETRQKISDRSKGTTRNALRTLTFEQAEEIRSKYIPRKYSTYKLAKEYGVAQRNIFQILKNITYTQA
tara:strand:- start:390 stop:944 length:555 start_codon:yes stop_codon:yes gene_type:complete